MNIVAVIVLTVAAVRGWLLYRREKRAVQALRARLEEEQQERLAWQMRHDNARYLLRGAYEDCERYRSQLRILGRIVGRQTVDVMRPPVLWEN
ncbi:hypothetical protein [Caldilinea sp.]|uniref:hypothetical protein n=1 Tax=Caldilinea sp. TaxID=2293560 RepID=UPI0021DCE11F|nr:hypothetical protein [Caldilinea sp.]GIV73519.1 MAG: hypothetical protein KatS3mg049_2075 [Caldilinea sp.]